MADTTRQPGWREVLVVSTLVVAVVLGAAIATSLLPAGVQGAIFHLPVLILVLIVGTAWMLWRIARPRPASPPPASRATAATPPAAADPRTEDRP